MLNMTGTTGSTFTTFAEFVAGKVGYRNIGGDQYRVRVEPSNGALSFGPDWKQPDSQQNRYSIVVNGPLALGAAIGTAVNVLTFASASSLQ